MGKRTQSRDRAVPPLYGVFALTGVGTALLGATLPVMLVQWRLTDANAGVLFLVLFLSSSMGSLANRRPSSVRAGWASALLAVCCVGLGLAHGWPVFPLTALYGFGLGVGISTVTRVRLLCDPAQRVREVNRLNLVWGLGAFLCPGVANEVIRHAGVRGLFLALVGIFAITAVWILGVCSMGEAHWSGASQEAAGGKAALPWIAAAGAFLAVGLESAFGAWLGTYTHRLAAGFAAPVEATTLFWLGLLASRAVCSTAFVQRFNDRQMLAGFLSLTAAGCALLVAFSGRHVVLSTSLLLGFGIGPVFPILLAAVLPRVRGNLIFVIAGMGASALPWLTGALSQRFGSLRIGLLAPVLAGAVLLAMALPLTRALQRLEDDAGARVTPSPRT